MERLTKIVPTPAPDPTRKSAVRGGPLPNNNFHDVLGRLSGGARTAPDLRQTQGGVPAQPKNEAVRLNLEPAQPLVVDPRPTAPAATAGQTLVQTPFGTVVVPDHSAIDLKAVFGGVPTPSVTAAPVAAPPAPSPQSVFGEHVWMNSPSGTDPNNQRYSYNPVYFATRETADKVASMIGGTVIAQNAMAAAGGFQQAAPNWMVKMPNGTVLNPGLIASFYNHGYPQSYVDYLVKCEVRGSQS